MNDTITISKTELELMIAEAIARNTLPRKKKDFRDVQFRHDDFEKINMKYPILSERLTRRFSSQVTDEPSVEELRIGRARPISIYSRKRYAHGINNYEHSKIYTPNVSDMLRHLSLAVMGATIIKDLDDDEFEHSLKIYEDFKNLFLKLYDERLEAENKILENIQKDIEETT